MMIPIVEKSGYFWFKSDKNPDHTMFVWFDARFNNWCLRGGKFTSEELVNFGLYCVGQAAA